MEVLSVLTLLAVIVLAGALCSFFSRSLRLPKALLLLLSGMSLRFLLRSQPLGEWGMVFLSALALLMLIMIVFEAGLQLRIREFDTLSGEALRFAGAGLVLRLALISGAVYALFSLRSFIGALLFAVLVAPDWSMVQRVTGKESRVTEFLGRESRISSLLAIFAVFIVIGVVQTSEQTSGVLALDFIGQAAPVLQHLVTGVAVGVVLGLIGLRILRKVEAFSSLAVAGFVLFAFVLAESLRGNGVLAVAALGLLAGNLGVRKRTGPAEVSAFFSGLSEWVAVGVFVLAGCVAEIPLNPVFLAKTLALFVLLVLVRFIAFLIISIIPQGETGGTVVAGGAIRNIKNTLRWTLREKAFMSLSAPPGIVTAAIVLALWTLFAGQASSLYASGFPTELQVVLQAVVAVMIWSILGALGAAAAARPRTAGPRASGLL
ncbi:hypothetical protein COY95_00775 [Candidatus Woesearchaeota archaeon CG_4_10_14_0_8_um_filter_47_5]|nr:MAG: hypothetical protein COY95_00775 [Candidatus Woesearchaeota archaeon CG_4_10_14_0_8_um_filter_47_5]